MEISSDNYWESLPMVLEAIAGSKYVSIDLEMTGVDAKDAASSRKPTLDSVYQQAKMAAQRFQVVQFGLTCIAYDESTKEYRSRTFTFLITPWFVGQRPADEKLAKCLDRFVGFSFSSLMFLRKHNFQISQAFQKGVPYLSQSEIAEIDGGKFLQSYDRDDTDGFLNLADYDQEAIDFYNNSMKTIDDWYKSAPRGYFVNIANPYGGRLNTLQVRIVEEIVRVQYPDCRTFPRNNRDFMQVIERNEARDEEIAANMLRDRKDAVSRHKGFTFVMEALAGHDFTDTLPVELLVDRDAPSRSAAIVQMTEKLKRFQTIISKKQPILIGHNALYDLCFLYQSFCGPLPATIEMFGSEIRDLFPRIVDTKYLARHPVNHSMAPDESLTDLFQSSQKWSMPKITGDFDPQGVYTSHDAGYDSWMTSVVFLKYAWQLANGQTNSKASNDLTNARAEEEAEQHSISLKQLGEAIAAADFSSADANWEKNRAWEEQQRAAMQDLGSDPELAPLIAAFPAPPGLSYGTTEYDPSWIFREDSQPVESLLDAHDAGVPGFEPLVPSNAPSPVPDLADCLRQVVLRKSTTSPNDYGNRTEHSQIPEWHDNFWRDHRNKIRVLNVGVLDLDLDFWGSG